MVSFGAPPPFSGGSGRCGRTAQLAQKAQRPAWHVAGGQRLRFTAHRAGVPGGPQVRDFGAHPQPLPIGQGAHLPPQVTARGLRGAVGVESQVLLQKPESVLNGEAPQVQQADGAEGDRERASPEHP